MENKLNSGPFAPHKLLYLKITTYTLVRLKTDRINFARLTGVIRVMDIGNYRYYIDIVTLFIAVRKSAWNRSQKQCRNKVSCQMCTV